MTLYERIMKCAAYDESVHYAARVKKGESVNLSTSNSVENMSSDKPPREWTEFYIGEFEHPEMQLGESKIQFLLKLAKERDELRAELNKQNAHLERILKDQVSAYEVGYQQGLLRIEKHILLLREQNEF